MKEILAGQRFELSLHDPAYPKSLLNLSNPPDVLYGIGNPEAMTEGIAIVGSRRISDYGRECAQMFADETANQGITIISGGARGCDTIAHQSALKHNAPTVAVLGGGCDHVYPSENFNLFQKIIAHNGCVVSEQPFDTEPMPWMLRARNRIVAAMAKATLVVEAGLPSGTFSTVDYALSAGREVLAIPGDITRPQAQGTNRMIFKGAMPITSLDVYRDVLYRLSLDQPSKDQEQLMTPVKTSLKEVCEQSKQASEALKNQAINQPIKSQEAR